MWHNFGIAPFSREPSADELLEAIRAEAVLAAMDFHEDLATLSESEPVPSVRRELAETYHRLIGVYPHERDAFRGGLERVRDGGGMPVADLIILVRRRARGALHSEK